MNYQEVIFWHIDLNPLTKINNQAKYIILSQKDYNQVILNLPNFKIKPIVVAYNGAYVKDLETDTVIIDKPIAKEIVKKIGNYCQRHDVTLLKDKYVITLLTKNYSRLLIMPGYFNDCIAPLTFYTKLPIKVNNGYQHMINNCQVNLLATITALLNYLEAKNIDLITLNNWSLTMATYINAGNYQFNLNSLASKSNLLDNYSKGEI
jgi:hypothetical protein